MPHRENGNRYVATSDELLTSFLDLETQTRQRNFVQASRLLVVCHPVKRSSTYFNPVEVNRTFTWQARTA